MVLNNKPFESIDESDLQAIVDNQVVETKTLEYKAALPTNTYEDKKEFLADVSSLANAAGGHLIYGIRAEAGLPKEVCGLGSISTDHQILRLEGMLQTNIEPRLPGVLMRPIALHTGGNAIVIRIPRSWAGPHVVKFEKHWRFYSRNSAGKYPLDVAELGAAFNLSQTAAEHIRAFRTERLGSIVAGQMPIATIEGAKIVLHLVPLDAFALGKRYSFPSGSFDPQFFPIYGAGWTRVNFDGWLAHSGTMRATAHSYVQLFRNGTIEAVDLELLHGKSEIPSISFEDWLINAVRRYMRVQRSLGVEPPLLVMLSLVGVAGYTMAAGNRFSNEAYPIDRDTLVIPEILVETFDMQPETILRPLFDAVWNACGWSQSIYYDEGGQWNPPR